jgi:hypothetical protein
MICVIEWFASNKKRLVNLTATTMAVAAWEAGASDLAHLHGDGENSNRFQLQGACQIIATGVDAHWCNPANLAENDLTMAQFEAGVRADEEGAALAGSILSQRPKKSDVEKLFKRRNFAAVSAYGRLETIFNRYSISYTPSHIIAAYRVNNPALPEIFLVGFQESVLRVESGWRVFETSEESGRYTLDLGASLYSFNREYVVVEDQLINLAINRDSKIGDIQSTRGADADVGAVLKTQTSWLPDLGLKILRIGRRDDPRQAGKKLSISRYTTTQSQLSLGKTKALKRGALGLEVSTVQNGYFKKFDIFRTGAGIQYRLGGLTVYCSGSPLMESFGFSFDGPVYVVGIQYTNEKQSNDIQLDRQRMTYVYAKIQL